MKSFSRKMVTYFHSCNNTPTWHGLCAEISDLWSASLQSQFWRWFVLANLRDRGRAILDPTVVRLADGRCEFSRRKKGSRAPSVVRRILANERKQSSLYKKLTNSPIQNEWWSFTIITDDSYWNQNGRIKLQQQNLFLVKTFRNFSTICFQQIFFWPKESLVKKMRIQLSNDQKMTK